MVDVFISYSRTNQPAVKRLAEAVKAAGYDVWWDAELPPHKSYGDVITEKIGMAKAAIVVWSKESAASEWVRAEADVARNQKKLIQTSLDDIMPPMPFNQIQYAAIGDWNGEEDHVGWRKVKASLSDLCGPRDPTGVAQPAYPMPSGPPPAYAPPPPGAAYAHPAPVKSGSNTALIAGGAVAVLLLGAALIYLLLSRGGDDAAPASAESTVAAGPAPVGGTATDPRAARFDLAATTNDPDPTTNVRAGPSSDTAIVVTVPRGEVFTTYQQAGDWWQIRTANGITGYMHRPLIQPIGASNAAGDSKSDAGSALAAAPMVGEAPGVPPPAPASTVQQIIPDSSSRRLIPSDVASLSLQELRLARNEIFARNGRRFRDPALARYFAQFDWYRPAADEVALSPVEAQNVALLLQAEKNR